LPLPAHLFVRLADVDDFLNAGETLEARRVHAAVVADQPHRGALRTRHGAGLIAHLFDHPDDPLDFLLGRPVTHHDQHDDAPPPLPSMVNRSPSLAAATGPLNTAAARRAGSVVSTGG